MRPPTLVVETSPNASTVVLRVRTIDSGDDYDEIYQSSSVVFNLFVGAEPP